MGSVAYVPLTGLCMARDKESISPPGVLVVGLRSGRGFIIR